MNSNFALEPCHRDIPDDELIEDLVRVAAELKLRKVSKAQYTERGRVSAQTLANRFSSWQKALERAGLEKTFDYRICDEELFQNPVQVWEKLGRQPRYIDLQRPVSRYTTAPYERRFGTFRKGLAAFVTWANGGVVPPEPPKLRKKKGQGVLRTASWRQRAIVLMRDGAMCRMCGARPEHGARLVVDHVIPWSKGGETVLENLQILCEDCNLGKRDIDPRATGRSVANARELL